jgi:2-methylcitrate dehydratase PrpD
MDNTPVISPPLEALSAHIGAALSQPLPAEVAEITKHRLLDTLAAMVSGSQLEPGRAAISFIGNEGGAARCTVAGSRIVTTAINAAMANGMLAHGDETDDTHQSARFHPGCTIVPAAFAMAEAEGCSGQALLRAVALGYDVGTRLNQALGPKFMFEDAGHATYVGALFGAAAASSALAGLNAEQVRQALSYTAQQASGLPCWNRDPDHIEKSFDFGGMPARNAVTAAQLVASGFTGVADAFSGFGNFFSVFSREANPDLIAEGLGERFEILHANMKKWPVAMPAQSPLDALACLIAEHGVTASDVASVTLTLPAKRYKFADNSLMPDVCLQHLAALILVDGSVGFANSHDFERMEDADILAVRALVRIEPSAELDIALPPRQAIVEIGCKDGRTLRHHTKAVRGSAANPMSEKEVIEKALDLVAPVTDMARAKKLIETVLNIDGLADVTGLRPLLQAP